MRGIVKRAQVDGYQQETEWSCSAATLKAVLNHYGEDIPEEAIIEAIGARQGRGAETTDIVQGAQKLGFEAWEGSFPSLEDAHQVLASGTPIIADIQSFNYPGKGHYVVISGFKPGKGYILMDPNTKGKTAIPNWRIVSPEKLEEIWWDRAMAPPHELMPKWGVVVAPKMEKTADARLGWKELRRAKAESARARDYNKYGGDLLPSSERTLATVETNESGRPHVEKKAGRVQLDAFLDELEKVGYLGAGIGAGSGSLLGILANRRTKAEKKTGRRPAPWAATLGGIEGLLYGGLAGASVDMAGEFGGRLGRAGALGGIGLLGGAAALAAYHNAKKSERRGIRGRKELVGGEVAEREVRDRARRAAANAALGISGVGALLGGTALSAFSSSGLPAAIRAGAQSPQAPPAPPPTVRNPRRRDDLPPLTPSPPPPRENTTAERFRNVAEEMARPSLRRPRPEIDDTSTQRFKNVMEEIARDSGKTKKASEVAEAAFTAAKILGVIGAGHGVATKGEDEGTIGSALGGGLKGALIGALVGAGLARNAEGKTTIPHPKSWAHKKSPGALRKILAKLI